MKCFISVKYIETIAYKKGRVILLNVVETNTQSTYKLGIRLAQNSALVLLFHLMNHKHGHANFKVKHCRHVLISISIKNNLLQYLNYPDR